MIPDQLRAYAQACGEDGMGASFVAALREFAIAWQADLCALQEVASWEDEAPARGEREFARMVLSSNGSTWPGPAVASN